MCEHGKENGKPLIATLLVMFYISELIYPIKDDDLNIVAYSELIEEV